MDDVILKKNKIIRHEITIFPKKLFLFPETVGKLQVPIFQ